jgi:hypothetical protein
MDEADYLVAHIPGVGREQFKRDETLKRAFVRGLEIIGEAIKKAPMGCGHEQGAGSAIQNRGHLATGRRGQPSRMIESPRSSHASILKRFVLNLNLDLSPEASRLKPPEARRKVEASGED